MFLALSMNKANCNKKGPKWLYCMVDSADTYSFWLIFYSNIQLSFNQITNDSAHGLLSYIQAVSSALPLRVASFSSVTSLNLEGCSTLSNAMLIQIEW